MIKVFMEYRRVLEDMFGIQTGPLSSFETLKKELGNRVEFVSDINKCDVVHIHNVDEPYVFFDIATEKPIVVHAHVLPMDLDEKMSNSPITRFLIWSYLSPIYKKANRVIAVSQFEKELLLRLGIENRRIRVIGNGIDRKKFAFDRKKRIRMRKALGIENDELVVYSVGVVQKRKGVEDFIKIAAMNPSLQFVWFGGFAPYMNGYSKEDIEIKIKKMSNIRFTGFVDDIVAAHCCGDIFFFPSLFETQGIVLLEAAQCRRPMLLRDIPAYDEFEDGVSCIKATNLGEFNRKLGGLIKNEGLRKKISGNAYEKVKEYDVKNIARQILKVYKELLRKKPK